MNGAMLEVKGLNVSFQTSSGPLHAVRDLSLTVAPGEVVGLVGRAARENPSP